MNRLLFLGLFCVFFTACGSDNATATSNQTQNISRSQNFCTLRHQSNDLLVEIKNVQVSLNEANRTITPNGAHIGPGFILNTNVTDGRFRVTSLYTPDVTRPSDNNRPYDDEVLLSGKTPLGTAFSTLHYKYDGSEDQLTCGPK